MRIRCRQQCRVHGLRYRVTHGDLAAQATEAGPGERALSFTNSLPRPSAVKGGVLCCGSLGMQLAATWVCNGRCGSYTREVREGSGLSTCKRHARRHAPSMLYSACVRLSLGDRYRQLLYLRYWPRHSR